MDQGLQPKASINLPTALKADPGPSNECCFPSVLEPELLSTLQPQAFWDYGT